MLAKVISRRHMILFESERDAVFSKRTVGKCFMFLSSADFFFKINFFEKIFQEYHQFVKQVWIQIRPDVLSGLIWVQNCLQRLSADDTGSCLREKENLMQSFLDVWWVHVILNVFVVC